MKNLLTLAAATALLTACNNGLKSTHSITVQIDGAGGKTLYFDQFVNQRPEHLDSIQLDADGKGVLKLPAWPLDFYALTFGGEEVLILLLDSADDLKITANAASLQDPTSVEGSRHTALLHGFFKDSQKHDEEMQKLMNRLRTDNTDTAAMMEYARLTQDFRAHTLRFIQDNMSSPAVLAALYRPDMQQNMQEDMSLFRQVRDSLRQTIPQSEYFASYRDLVDRADQQLAAIKQQEEQQALLDQMIQVGHEAPDFKQDTPDGKSLSLSSLRGQVVLIDFWASWCKPCRIENPNVKRVYDKYHKKGFEILGVSLDKERAAWLQAIEHDGLPWKHVSDLAAWNNAAAKQYGVSAIPYTVLLDRQGRVIAKNLRGKALEDKLAEVFQ